MGRCLWYIFHRKLTQKTNEIKEVVGIFERHNPSYTTKRETHDNQSDDTTNETHGNQSDDTTNETYDNQSDDT